MYVVPASNDVGVSSWKPQPIHDEYRCEGRDGMGRRCQLVVGHGGQHVLQAVGSRLTWPVGAEPHLRPPWAVSFPRDED